jgi:class II flagellar assembly regulator FliX
MGSEAIMRIQGPAGTAMATSSATSPRRASSGTFSVNEHSESSATKGPSATRSFGGIDALIALQGVDDPMERRRQGVKRGRLALDALDELKIGLLGGTLTPATLNKLRSAAAFLKDGSGEAGLDGVLDEIELRVEVEIAKISMR